MRLFIADARSEMRFALMMYLGQEPGLHVTGIAVDAQSLLAQVKATQPDIVLVDWQLPGASMQDLLADVRGLVSPPKLIVLSVNPEVKTTALSAGADVFISKTMPSNELLRAIHSLKKTMETEDIEEP